jgi:hypothetical protein
MNHRITAAAVLAVSIAFAIACINHGIHISANTFQNEADIVAAAKPNKTMKPFSSEKELKDYFVEQAKKQKAGARGADTNAAANSPVTTDSVAAAKSEAQPAKDDKESITNTQHAGVDEGGIVKVHGEHLVILRRGRLFTVRVGDDSLKPVAAVDAYAPGVDPRNDWYDEMLVTQDTVAVVGYSYGRGGTEINLFDIDDAGRLAYRSTYHLRSNDYYSSRNYASRMIGTKLIFYTPEYIGYYGDPMAQFPAVRRWHKGATNEEFERIVPATNVYLTAKPTESAYGSALHTVTVCDLADRNFACKGTSVLGAPGRVFYVSPNSVYVWTTDWSYADGKSKASSMLYKMPLDGSAPSAIGVEGTPVDQFSFLESEDNNLNVLVRSDGYGDGMWGAEFSSGDIGLLRLPIDRFSDGSETVSNDMYRELPKPEGNTFQNRFVGNYLLYGTGSGWGAPEQKDVSNLFAVNWTTGGISNFRLQHGVDRIEQMGKDAIVIGTNGQDLYFTPISLTGRPKAKPSYARKNASQGELRSHGFFYKSEDADSGIVGLPIAREGREGYRHLIENSAAIIFLRNNGLQLDPLGELGSKTTSTNDNCKASCVDWYGNARPIFLRGRIFALLGYELVEGKLDGSQIQERRRVNYSHAATDYGED